MAKKKQQQPNDEEVLDYLDSVIQGRGSLSSHSGRRRSSHFQSRHGSRRSSLRYNSVNRRRSSVWRQGQRRTAEDDGSVRVYELPPPTVSQRRRGSAAVAVQRYGLRILTRKEVLRVKFSKSLSWC